MTRGFTLIEILIAATVLGLGVLGIATLFAGAAQQQRLAFDQLDSLRAEDNIEALLDDRFVRFGGVALSDENSLAANAYLMPGQWHAVPSQAVGTVTGGLAGALLFDLIDDGTANQTVYGVAEVGDFTLYRASWTDPTDVPPEAWSNPSNMPGQAAPGPFDFATLDTLRMSGSAYLQPIPTGRLHPGFDVVVTFEAEVPSFGGGGGGLTAFEGRTETLRFQYRSWNNTGVEQTVTDFWPLEHTAPGLPADQIPRAFRTSARNLYLIAPTEGMMVDQPDNSANGDSFLQFKVQRPGTSDSLFAWLDDCRINMPANTPDGGRWIIREIRIENLQYREDLLLAQSARVSSVSDASFPGGRRPSRGVAMLYRRSLAGDDQLIVLSYTLEALGRVSFDPQTELPLVLPDTFEQYYQRETGLMEQVRFELAYDMTEERYTLTVDDPGDEWALQKDQLVVIASQGGPVDATNADRTAVPGPIAGADSAVRVLRTRRVGTDLVAFLDGAPRSGFDSMLADLSMTEMVHGWVLRDVIRSETGGDTEVDWRVRPTGARLITLGGGS